MLLLPVRDARLPAAAIVVAGVGAAVATGLALAHAGGVTLLLGSLFALAFVVLAVRNLVAALAVFVVLSFVEQIPGASSGVTPVKAAGAVLVLLWALGLLRRRFDLQGLLGARLPFVVAIVGFVGWAVASSLWSTSPGTAMSAAERLVQGVLLCFVVVSCIRDARALRMLLVAFLIGALLSAILGLAGLAGSAAATPAADVRVGGGLGDPNYLAAVIVPAVFIALGLRETTTGRRVRLLLLGAIAVLVVGLLRTESRGALVALVACGLMAAVFGGQVRKKTLAAIGGIFAAAVVYFAAFASASSLHRVLDLGTSGSASSGRTELWAVALRAFRAHPVAGVGAGNFSVVEPGYAAFTDVNLTKSYLELDLGEVVHNTYLQVVAELGVVGILFFAIALVTALWVGMRASRVHRQRGNFGDETIVRCLVIGAVGMLVAFAFLTAQYEKQLWLVLGFLLAAHALTRATAARKT